MTRLDEFAGNRHLVALLRRRPLPQASIFAGPEGVGKKTLALTLAALANCKSSAPGDGADACGECPSCRKIEAECHPDVRLYRPDGVNIKIESMREMRREAQFRPFEGRRRIFIIDQADRLTLAAANSILKTLEEPPETSALVLITSNPDRLLETIRSRCQHFGFRPLSREDIRARLAALDCQEDLDLRTAWADGSIGHALSLDLDRMRADRDMMLEILEGWLSDHSFSSLFGRIEDPALRQELKNRQRVIQLLERLQSLGEDLYFVLTETSQRIVNIDRKSQIESLAKGLSLKWVRRFLSEVFEARRDIEAYVNPLMVFETLWLRAG